jgi:raffinose/stachyose/melibiose transport system substrate-binding protein
MRTRWLSAIALVVAALVVAACGGTPGQDKPAASTGSSTAQANVKTSGFESLGPVTLRVVTSETSGGPRAAIKSMSAAFEQKYPNVTVKVSYRDFSSWIKQVKLTLASKNPPDVVGGNQGYQVDGELVKAGLILPLDKYAKAYNWEPSFSPQSLQQFKWSPDGKTFGSGTLYGIAQSGQSTGVFANMAKLKKAGVDPSALKTFDDFDAALAKVKPTLPASEPVIMLGNKEQYEALHLWGMIQGAYTPAQEVRDWIFHRSGGTFDTPGNRQALDKLKEWQDKGYLGRGDDYNGRGEQDAANEFARGKGAFMLAGNWNAQTILDGLKDDAAFFDMPAGKSGKAAAIGSTSVPIHIASKSKNPDLAAAYIDFITGPTAGQALVDTQQVPAATDGTAEPGDPLGKDVKAGWDQLVEDGGLTLYPDWTSPTMLQTMGQSFQEMLAGRISPKDVISRTQKDWEGYQKELGN